MSKLIKSIEMNHLKDSTEICITFDDSTYKYVNLSNNENGLFIGKNADETTWIVYRGDKKENLI